MVVPVTGPANGFGWLNDAPGETDATVCALPVVTGTGALAVTAAVTEGPAELASTRRLVNRRVKDPAVNGRLRKRSALAPAITPRKALAPNVSACPDCTSFKTTASVDWREASAESSRLVTGVLNVMRKS